MRVFSAWYEFLITIPDRFYPFKTKVDGRVVRGRLAYEHAAKLAIRKYGIGRIGYKLALYREIFHFIGSALVIVGATLISKDFFGSDTALYVLLFSAIAVLSYQEFYLHPKRYGQHVRKGLMDWLVWVVPMLVYIFR